MVIPSPSSWQALAMPVLVTGNIAGATPDRTFCAYYWYLRTIVVSLDNLNTPLQMVISHESAA
jgi:hypothetical protein